MTCTKSLALPCWQHAARLGKRYQTCEEAATKTFYFLAIFNYTKVLILMIVILMIVILMILIYYVCTATIVKHVVSLWQDIVGTRYFADGLAQSM